MNRSKFVVSRDDSLVILGRSGDRPENFKKFKVVGGRAPNQADSA